MSQPVPGSVTAPDGQLGGLSQGFRCELCTDFPRYFRTQSGLNIHKARMHKSSPAKTPPRVTVTPPSPSPRSPSPGSSEACKPFWQTLSDLKSRVPVVKRIPRGARVAVALALGSCIDRVVASNGGDAWEDLLTFTYKHLNVDIKHDKKLSLTQRIKNSCVNPEFPSLSDSVSRCSNSGLGSGAGRNFFRKVEEKVSDGDLSGASRLLFSSDTVAPVCEETLRHLRDKHPTADPVSLTVGPDSADIVSAAVTVDEIVSAIMSFKNGSSGGLDGVSPQHLRDLVCPSVGDPGRKLAASLASLADFMLSGGVNDGIADVLYGANLCALKKKDGGIRPIAIGSTFRRLVSKISCKRVGPSLTGLFQPTQVGFGSRGGCEAAVHATRAFLENDPSKLLLKVDVKNAFNSLDRGAILYQVRQHIPSLLPYLSQCYGSPSKLVYKGNLLNSAVGCQQGDPLGPAIFSLGIHPCISTLKSDLNVWYLDDGTLEGDPVMVLEDLRNLISTFSGVGLELNFAKCEVFLHPSVPPDRGREILREFGEVAPGIQLVSGDSLRLLGAPLLDSGIPGFIDEQSSKFDGALERLLKISPHVALTLIKYCLFVPQFMYALRCAHFWKFEDLLLVVDERISRLLGRVLNCQFTSEAWSQASLPVRFGGLGIRSVSSVALPAFLASVHGCRILFDGILGASLARSGVVHLSGAVDRWRSLTSCDFPAVLHSQRQWDEPLCRLVQQTLLAECSGDVHRARLLASFERESGVWLNAIPSANVGTLLDRNTLSLAVGLRLGLRVVQPHQCVCGAEVTSLGHHGLSCQRSLGRIPRHSALNDVIRRALASANMPAMLEPNGIVRSDGKRPDGVTLIPWEQGRCLVWDATCVDTLAPSHLLATRVQAGAAASGAEAAKVRKYEDMPGCYIFTPLGFETVGCWGPCARTFLRELSARLVEATGDPRAGGFLSQRLSIAIQRGNAASILGTMPREGMAEGFLLF